MGTAIWPSFLGGGPIRVTQYRFVTGAFTGTTYDLTLNNSLEENYFVLISGHYDVNSQGAAPSSIRVSQDPFGTGGLGTSSGADVIRLTRTATGLNDWLGTVTVIEATGGFGPDSFKLLDVDVTTMSGTTSTTQDVTSTVAAWNDINKVVPFGGQDGGGATIVFDGSETNFYHDVVARIHPSSTSTLNYRRMQDAAYNDLKSATFTTYVVEWGANWNVQSVNITGANAGDGINATGEYSTGSISSVARDNTWVWGCGTTSITSQNNKEESSRSLVYTLGDGVNQNASETSVAVGSEVSVARDVYIYAMENILLAVDYRFVSDADPATPNGVTVDAAIVSENIDTVSNPRSAEGRRAGVGYVSMDASDNTYRRSIIWPFYTGDTNLDIYRKSTGEDYVGWIQSVDFGNVP